VIIAKTYKGKNFGEDIEGIMHYHGKPLGDKAEYALNHLKSLIKNMDVKLDPSHPDTQDYVPRNTNN